jgi:hypothetical protein
MGKIVISENVTLDGVIEDPAGDEGFRVGGWVGLIKDSPQLNKLALDEALGAEPSESSRALSQGRHPGERKGSSERQEATTAQGLPVRPRQSGTHGMTRLGSPGSGSYNAPAA